MQWDRGSERPELTTVILRAQLTGVPPPLGGVLAAAALGLCGVESFGH